MTHASLRMTTVAIGLALGGLATVATLATVLQSPAGIAAPEPPAAVISRQELRLEAARASLGARPLIGASHLPPYDARAAIAREESALRQLSSTRTATR